jgi:hypothetical protein
LYLYNDGTNTPTLDAYDYGTKTPLDIRVGGNGGNVFLGGTGGAVTINNNTNSFVLPSTRPTANGQVIKGNTDGTTSWQDESAGSSTQRIVVINDIDYTVAPGVKYVRFHDNFTADRTLTLPSASANANRSIVIYNGNLNSHQLNFRTTSGSLYLISTTPAASVISSINFAFREFVSDGTNWYLMSYSSPASPNK